MISAKATTEHKIKGQIGHPAACMMENKMVSWWSGGLFWRLLTMSSAAL